MGKYYDESSLQITPEYGQQSSGYTPDLGQLSAYRSLDVGYRRYSADLRQESADTESLLNLDNCKELEQGAIFSDIKSYLVEQQGNQVIVHEIFYSRVVVLSQACDLRWNYSVRNEGKSNHDKLLFTALVAPMFDLEKAKEGEHLSGLRMKMERITSKKREFVKVHDVARYYQFNKDEFLDGAIIGFDKSIVDFKHFFTVPISQFTSERYLTSLLEYHRERLSHRFASYLSRIGIPE